MNGCIFYWHILSGDKINESLSDFRSDSWILSVSVLLDCYFFCFFFTLIISFLRWQLTWILTFWWWKARLMPWKVGLFIDLLVVLLFHLSFLILWILENESEWILLSMKNLLLLLICNKTFIWYSTQLLLLQKFIIMVPHRLLFFHGMIIVVICRYFAFINIKLITFKVHLLLKKQFIEHTF